MVEFTNEQVIGWQLLGAYRALSNCKMSAKSFYSYNKIGEWLGKVSKEARTKYMDLVKKYAALNEDGTPKEVDGKWAIADDKMEEFTKGVADLMSEKNSLDWSKLRASDIEGSLTPREWAILEPMIEA